MKLEEAQQEREMKMRKDQEFQLRVLQMLSGYGPPMYRGQSYYLR